MNNDFIMGAGRWSSMQASNLTSSISIAKRMGDTTVGPKDMSSQIDSLNLPRVKCLKLSFDYFLSLDCLSTTSVAGLGSGQRSAKKSL